MTVPNDTEMKVYDQLMQVRRCIEALKDVAYNMPEDDRYCAVLGVITERLDNEFIDLTPLALLSFRDEQAGTQHSRN